MQSWTAISPDLANGHVQNLGTITTVDVAKSTQTLYTAEPTMQMFGSLQTGEAAGQK
jgi:hypothetical protein